MFYSNRSLSFKINGIFAVERKPKVTDSLNRTHTAISYRIRGKSVITANGTKTVAEGGSIAYFPAGVDFNRKTETDESLIILHLDASGECGEKIEIIPDCEFLATLFYSLTEAWEAGEYNRCMSLLYEIFEGIEKRGHREVREPSELALEILKKSFKDPELSVKKLAHGCSVSEVYLRRIFRERYGTSPLEMILKLRFDYAKSLLISGYYTPKQTAELCGFTDIKYFREAFRNRCGLSPTEFRKMAQKKNTDAMREAGADLQPTAHGEPI
ncbi:MAG: helix-turn-helix transcriptional regulator [Clostridia bacterium]|nr:helix-turn-helix transcriptional regulator [Clostridia bacterium]